MKTAYQKRNHNTPDLSDIVWKVASTAQSYRLLEKLDDRVENKIASAFSDLLAKGHQKLEAATLKTFNKKLCEWIDGVPLETLENGEPIVDMEIDDLPAPQFSLEDEEEHKEIIDDN
ncbi:hypothetical protein VKT23_012283 [Stygiomarasmius scandens]|uniref:Uncharacterized protein n=1 Tax=Marasmiellus scandens TaxID=2682957 RepID=A0ABR1JAJ9_9AGAR